MNILFLVSNISLRGGTERSCIAVANELAQRGHLVHLFSVGGNVHEPAFPVHSDIVMHGLNIQHQGIKLRLVLPEIYVALGRYIRSHQISHIINVEIMSSWFSLFFCFIRPKTLKYIAWEHFNFSVDLGLRQRRWLRSLMAQRADAIVTLTRQDAGMWQDNLKPKAKLTSIYNPSPFQVSTHSYPIHSKEIIAIGRFTYQKGYDLLVDSWKKLQDMQHPASSGWKLSIIGAGEEWTLVENLIHRNGLSESIQLIPNSSNIGRYYENASFLCMSSRFEGLPMVLIEAQSYGLPIVSFDCLTGPADIINEKSGYLCPPLDTGCFAQSMLKMMENTDERLEMSRTAKTQALRFAPAAIGKSWESFLKSC